MITKQELIEAGFERVQGSSVWQCPKSKTFVVFNGIKLDTAEKVLDGNKDSLSSKKSSETKVKKVSKKEKAVESSTIVDTMEIIEDTVVDEIDVITDIKD